MEKVRFNVYSGDNARIMFGVDLRCSSPADLARFALSGAPVVAITTHEQWRDGRGLTPLCARKALIDSGELTPDFASLRGKRVGMELSDGKMRPEPDWIIVHRALERGGLTWNDVRVVETPHGATTTELLAQGAVDIVNMPRPRAVVLGEERGLIQRWHECWDITSRQGRCVVANKSFVDAHPGAVQGFVTGWIRASRDYVDAMNQGKGRTEILDLLVRHSGEDRKVVEGMSPLGLDPNGMVDIASMQRDAETWASHGLLPAGADVARAVDLSFAERALKELGPYA
jgi:NitT/TauT family transport system substrate-binding protein